MVSKRIELYGLKPVVGDLVRTENIQKKAEAEEVLEAVQIVNEGDLDNFTIENVVLPLPGFNVIYPKNDMKSYYEQLLQADDLNMNSFKNKIKDLSLGGDYRNILVRPKELSYKVIDYSSSESETNLVRSDLDILQNKPQVALGGTGELKALVIEYNLPSSAYATMALRELLVDEDLE